MAARTTPSIRQFLVLAVVLSILLSECYHQVEARVVRSSRPSRFSNQNKGMKKAHRRPSTVESKPPVKTFRSSVTKSQVSPYARPKRLGLRFTGGTLLVYAISEAPVFTHRYSPYHTCDIIIPKNRALRIKKEEYRLENDKGENCTGSSNVTRDDEQNLLNVTTTISYEADPNVTTAEKVSELAEQKVSTLNTTNITMSNALDYYIINIETRAEYNRSVVNEIDSNCTVVVTKVQAYMVEMGSTSQSSPSLQALPSKFGSLELLVTVFASTLFSLFQ